MTEEKKESGRNVPSDLSFSYLERRWFLYILDVLGLTGGLLASLYIREDYDLSWQLILENPEWLLFLYLVWFFIGYLFQVYDIEKVERRLTGIVSALIAALISVTLYNIVPYIPPTLPPSRFPLFMTLGFPILLILGGRVLYLLIFSQQRFRRRILILGAGWAGKTVFQALMTHAQTFYEVIGFIDDDPAKQDQVVEIEYYDPEDGQEKTAAVKVIGSRAEIIELVAQHQVSTVVFSISNTVEGQLYQILTDCLSREIEIIPMPLLYEQLTGKVPVEHIGDNWSIAMPLEQPGTQISWHALKRAFDLFWASMGLLVLLPLYPLIALAIRLDSRGPILYTQERMGRNGYLFQVIKFRSMVQDAEKDGAAWAVKDDARITRVGKLLRKTHLDEFPQFWNILKGEMSVVGPRPERPEFIQNLEKEIPFYRVRLAVKPGMAGWGLIHQGYGASKQDSLEKLQYDLFYIKHQSFWLDMQILWRTALDALSLRGR